FLISRALLQGIRQQGLDSLGWTPELRQWRARVQFMRRVQGSDSSWPDLSDENLLRTLEDWLSAYLDGVATWDRVKRIDLATPLDALLTWDQQRRLERLAPTHLTVPSGSRIRLDYETSDLPVLAGRLQEGVGCKDRRLLLGH